MVHLDPLCYPHIVEAILLNVSDRNTLLAARLVATSMLSLVYPLLCSGRLGIFSSEHGGYEAYTNYVPSAVAPERHEADEELFHGIVPYLCEGGDRGAQAAAMKQVTMQNLYTEVRL